MSEAGNLAIATPDNPVGCGRALPGVRIRVLDGDGAPVAEGELGEVEVNTPALMAGYLGDDGVLTPIGDRTWFRTGDLGRLDSAGNLRVVGRKRAVHRAGYTLYPEILERKAEACGRPVVVLGSADERLGSTLHFVVADGGDGTPREWRERMAPFLAHRSPRSAR
jgi:acyl-CoA synthetase (AMP-forming)/AMP-acid ligase II